MYQIREVRRASGGQQSRRGTIAEEQVLGSDVWRYKAHRAIVEILDTLC
jgi:hypothetical protein